MTRTRYGITYLGLLGAGGAGVYLGALPGGLVAVIAALFQLSPLLVVVPAGAMVGTWAGPIVAFITRRSIATSLTHRYLRASIAGAATMPFYLAIGIVPDVLGDRALNWSVGLALLCGVAAMVVYYQWRKRLTQQHRARRAAQRTRTA